MKKFLATLVIGMVLMSAAPSAKAVDVGAAAVVSAVLPGCGEWYNRSWKGGFPWAECILGSICPCIHFASVMDAVNGNTDDGLRIDFWTAPSK
jgi:hypothetical protein